jgi:hypothetical protein
MCGSLSRNAGNADPAGTRRATFMSLPLVISSE